MRYAGINITLLSNISKKRISNSVGIQFCDFVILKLFVGRNSTKMVENCKNCKI